MKTYVLQTMHTESGFMHTDCSKLTVNWKNNNGVTIFRYEILKIFGLWIVSLDNFIYWSKSNFNIITSSGVMTIFFFIKYWSEIRILEIPLSEFSQISGDCDKLRIPSLAQIFLEKCYWKLQNARFRAFIIFELLREKQQGENYLPPILELNIIIYVLLMNK